MSEKTFPIEFTLEQWEESFNNHFCEADNKNLLWEWLSDSRTLREFIRLVAIKAAEREREQILKIVDEHRHYNIRYVDDEGQPDFNAKPVDEIAQAIRARSGEEKL